MIHPSPDGSRGSQLYGLFLILMVLFLGGVLARDGYRAWRIQNWPAVPCTIVASGVEERGGAEPYDFRVLYRYAWNGRPHVGAVYRAGGWGSADLAEVERLARAFPAHAARTCYINPEVPAEAVLEREAPWGWIGVLACILAGVYLLARLYIFPSRSRLAPPVLKDLPVGRPAGLLLFLFLSTAGAFAFARMTAVPLARAIAAARWTPTPCTVLSAKVRSKVLGGEHPVTVWWVDIVYRYRVNGQDYRSNSYNATDLPTPWYYGERGIADRYPAGARATCHVNPRDPSDAVLDRGLSVDLWLGLWPLIMTALGVLGMIGMVTGRQLQIGRPAGWGRLGLWTAAGFAVQLAIVLGSDLHRDWRAGTAEWPEYLAVAVALAISGALCWGLFRWRRRAV